MTGKKEADDFKDYEKEVMDFDELGSSTEVKVNPQYYIHSSLMKISKVFEEDDLKVWSIKYRQIVEHIEILCKAAKMQPDDYDEKLRGFMNSESYKKKEGHAKSFSLAEKKLSLLLGEVFESKTIIDNLEL